MFDVRHVGKTLVNRTQGLSKYFWLLWILRIGDGASCLQEE